MKSINSYACCHCHGQTETLSFHRCDSHTLLGLWTTEGRVKKTTKDIGRLQSFVGKPVKAVSVVDFLTAACNKGPLSTLVFKEIIEFGSQQDDLREMSKFHMCLHQLAAENS